MLSMMRFEASIAVKKVVLMVLFVVVTILVFGYIMYRSDGDNLEKHFKEWKVSISTTGFKLTDFSESGSGGLAKEMIEAEGKSTVLKMTKIDTVAPQKYIEDKKFLLESLFLPTTSPYPGVITNIRECPEEFKPKVKDTENGTIYMLFAGARFNYGVCAQDLVEYSSIYGIFDCKEKGIFEVRVFSKTKTKEGLQPFIGSFSCG